jgi:hypothetical protein
VTHPTCDPSRDECTSQTPCSRCPLRDPVEGQDALFGDET